MEQGMSQKPEHEGERYLALLGLSDAADQTFTHQGKVYETRDFLEICGKTARPVLQYLEGLDQSDPKSGFTEKVTVLRDAIRQYIQGDKTG